MPRKKKTTKKPAINLGSLGQLAKRAVRAAQSEGGDGAAKGANARRMFAQMLDESLRFGDGPVGQIAEALDGPAGLLIASIVQGAYDELKAGKGL